MPGGPAYSGPHRGRGNEKPCRVVCCAYMQHGIRHGVWDYFVDKERFRYRFLEKAGCIHIFTAPERVSGKGNFLCLMPVQLFVSVTRFIVQYRITKLLESALFYKLPAIRFHILTPFLVGKLVVLPPFRGAILPFEKNAEDFRNFFKKIFEQQNTPVRKARTGVWVL